MNRILTLQYYFTPRPDPNFQYTKFTLAIVILFILGGLAITIYRKKYLKNPIAKKIIRSAPKLLQRYGTILLVLLLFREAGIPYFSMRIWWFLFMFALLISIIRFSLNAKKEYAKRLHTVKKVDIKVKYLPKKKKKN
ncbi:hypothetical protein COY07_02300 [Candidatus Peregrinibacteria bacterium CG_4_10_14_0_2_um_filter_43_11]|nr:MAG: hypothetical protein COY07_02300 [Candidatus Peregrinibacteria bacterium CG_4_10_14_0_2_um_filter_43_11]